MMRKAGIAPVVVGFVLLTVFGMAAADGEVAAGNNQFAIKLSQILDDGKNQFFSPISLTSVLGMLYAGAKGSTAKQISDTLQFPESDEAVLKQYKELFTGLKSLKSGVTLKLANKEYLQENFTVLDSYENKLKENFDVTTENLDFAENVQSAKRINDWVEKVTNSKIKDLIKPAMLNAQTRLVLVNGVYFYGKWEKKFDPKMTDKKTFYLDDTNSVPNVPMMYQSNKFQYSDSEELGAQVLGLPYKDSPFIMLIILPKTKTGLNDVMKKLETTDLSQIVQGLSTRKVEVTLPKWTVETDMDLNTPLEKGGLGEIFHPDKADFSGITGDKDLFVSQVVQKAMIEVNEEGSEAAAATGAIMMLGAAPMAPEPTPSFIADHPFTYCIYDGSSGAVLFFGKYVVP